MNQVVVGDEVWPMIADLLGARGKKRVAVAYIGQDAGYLLRDLRRGDILVCNAGLDALKQGVTFPSALREILAHGVTVRSLPSLHAKIYVAGSRAFVGSANASAGSIRREEAGVIVSGDAEVSALSTYVDDLARSRLATRVDANFLKLADLQFRPPRGGSGGHRRDDRVLSWRLHVWSFGDVAPVGIERAAEGQRGEVRPLHKDASATVDWSWGGTGAWRVGDVCLWVSRSDEPEAAWLVDPPAVCIAARPVGGKSKQVVFWWRTPGSRPLTWGKLQQAVLIHSGRHLTMGRTTRVPNVTTAVLDAFRMDTEQLTP